jgi:hypothetical protein
MAYAVRVWEGDRKRGSRVADYRERRRKKEKKARKHCKKGTPSRPFIIPACTCSGFSKKKEKKGENVYFALNVMRVTNRTHMCR